MWRVSTSVTVFVSSTARQRPPSLRNPARTLDTSVRSSSASSASHRARSPVADIIIIIIANFLLPSSAAAAASRGPARKNFFDAECVCVCAKKFSRSRDNRDEIFFRRVSGVRAPKSGAQHSLSTHTHTHTHKLVSAGARDDAGTREGEKKKEMLTRLPVTLVAAICSTLTLGELARFRCASRHARTIGESRAASPTAIGFYTAEAARRRRIANRAGPLWRPTTLTNRGRRRLPSIRRM
jgi:hypothetical protein